MILFISVIFLFSNSSLSTIVITQQISNEPGTIIFHNSSVIIRYIQFQIDPYETSLFFETSDAKLSSCSISGSSHPAIHLIGLLALDHFGLTSPLFTTPSFLISTPVLQSSISLSSSSFTNIEIPQSPASFIYSGYVSRQTIQDCSFINVSLQQAQRSPIFLPSSTADKSLLKNCQFYLCEDTFYGFILTGYPGSEFFVSNSSFRSCAHPPLRRQHSNTDFAAENYTVRLQLFGENSYDNCYFLGCSSESSGGALALLDTASATVTNCCFVNCSHTGDGTNKGGGAIVTLKGYLYASYSNFTNCSSAVYGGAIFLSWEKTQYETTLTNLVFCTNTATHGEDVCIYYTAGTPSISLTTCVTYTSLSSSTACYYSTRSYETGFIDLTLTKAGTSCPSGTGDASGVDYTVQIDEPYEDSDETDSCDDSAEQPSYSTTLYVSSSASSSSPDTPPGGGGGGLITNSTTSEETDCGTSASPCTLINTALNSNLFNSAGTTILLASSSVTTGSHSVYVNTNYVLIKPSPSSYSAVTASPPDILFLEF